MYSYIFWDFDGVLVDSEKYYFKVWKKILPLNIEFNDKMLIGKSNLQFLKSLDYSFSNIEINKIIKIKNDLILKKISSLRMNNELKSLIITLSQTCNCKFKITSNNSRQIIKKYLLKNNLCDYFEEIIVPNNFLKPKPSPSIYEYSSKNLNKSDILIIEDSPDGIKSAKLSGIKVINFDYFNFNKSINKIKTEFSLNEINCK